jgi:hypothetical protein
MQKKRLLGHSPEQDPGTARVDAVRGGLLVGW